MVAVAPQCGGNVPPCFGVHAGDTIAVTVVDSYDGNSNYVQVGPVYDHCDFGFDLTKGQVLQTTVVGTAATDDVCTVGMITVAPFANWTWTTTHTAPGSNPQILVGDAHASTNDGSCSGSLQLVFTVLGKDPFASSVQGMVPNVVLTRDFFGVSSATCPASCIGSFVVNLQKK